MWQNAKLGAGVGTAVTLGVGVITVPPLVAVMGSGGWAVGAPLAVGAGVATGYKAAQ